MKQEGGTGRATGSGRSGWIKYSLIVLIVEKIIQHIVVTMALYFNWKDIASTVAVSPSVLLVLGAIVGLLFMLSLWGMVTRKKWALNLVIGLALFDIVGEFVAQGTVFIIVTVSILVATILLILAMIYRGQQAQVGKGGAERAGVGGRMSVGGRKKVGPRHSACAACILVGCRH